MSDRYVYIVRGTEMGIVGVWSSRKEAIEEAEYHAREQGVLEYSVDIINESYDVITPLKYETYEKVEILRYRIQ